MASARRWRGVGAAVLGAATAGVAYSITDDVLLFQKGSRVALEAASQREEFTGLLGTPLVPGPWYNITLGVSHGGRSLSTTFPVTGPNGSAMVHARALRMKGSRSTLWYNLFESGEWHLFALHANVNHHVDAPATTAQGAPATSQRDPQSREGRGSALEEAPNGVGSAKDVGDRKSGSDIGASSPLQWKSVQIDLMSPMGIPPLPSSSQEPGVCLPCEANTKAKAGAPSV